MPTTSLTTPYQGLQKALRAGFRQRLNEQGELVRSNLSGGVRGKLVAYAESGSVSQGSMAQRLIRTAVGAQRYQTIARDLQENREVSIKNFAGLLKQDLQLDRELATLVERKVQRKLYNGQISAQAGAELAADITRTVSQRRRDRLEIAERVMNPEQWMMTPAMVTNTDGNYSEASWLEARMAYAQLSGDLELMPPANIAATDTTAGQLRRGLLSGRADLMVKEMRSVEQALLKPPELLARQRQLNALLQTETAANPVGERNANTGRLAELMTAVADLTAVGQERATRFKEGYLAMLAAIHDAELHGAQGARFKLPDTAAGDTVAHEPEPYNHVAHFLDAADGADLPAALSEKLSAATLELFNLGKPAAPPEALPESPRGARANADRHLRWAAEPVQVKTHELRAGDQTYTAAENVSGVADPELADLKAYNRSLTDTGRGKLNYDLDNTWESITLMEERVADGEDISPADEKELLQAFGLAHKIVNGYDRDNRIKGATRFQREWSQQPEQVRPLLQRPLLQPDKVLDYIAKQVYAAPGGVAMNTDGAPLRTALRGAGMENARLCLGSIARDPAAADADRQRAANLLRTVLQDAVAGQGARPPEADQQNAYRAELAALEQEWPAEQTLAYGNPQAIAIALDSFRKAINHTRAALENDIVNPDRSPEQVAEFISAEEGDRALRRLPTALQNFAQGLLRVENLPAESLNGPLGLGHEQTVAAWRVQSQQLEQLAAMIMNGRYSEDLPAGFKDYCTSGKDNAYLRMLAAAPEQDQGVRNWLQQGHALAERLLQAQEGAGKGALPLAAEELNRLRAEVEAFANRAA